MRYLLLIYGDEPTPDAPPDPELWGRMLSEYNAFQREMDGRGVLLGGHALQPTVTATTVRVRDRDTVTTDGPFAETKEALGGYYLIDVKDLDEAIEVAAKVPGSWYGSVEIRPIVEFSPEELAA
jgi:hypothetical protein